jgi:hypothetical protein
MKITRTACAKTFQHGATFIVETPVGYVDVQEVQRLGKNYSTAIHGNGASKPRGAGGTYFLAMVLEGWRYACRLDRDSRLTRNGKSRLAAKFARECYFIYAGSLTMDTVTAYAEGQARAEKWRDAP